MCPDTDPAAAPPVPPEPGYNTSDKEPDRDIINLPRREPEGHIATDEKPQTLYAPGRYDRMIEEFRNL